MWENASANPRSCRCTSIPRQQLLRRTAKSWSFPGKHSSTLKHEDTELFALLILNLARELARRLYITDQMLLDATARRTSAP
jgi:hypothetical protein